MKRLGVFLLMLLFLQSKIGLALNVHYCGKHIAKISWAFDAEGCGMEKKIPPVDTLQFSQKNCCEDDVVIAQNDTNHTSAKAEHVIIGSISITSISNAPLTVGNVTESIHLYDRPPPVHTLYKKNCAFLFYG